MFHVIDVRETKVYQEAFEEGYKTGFDRSMAEVCEKFIARTVALLRDEKFSIEEIVKLTGFQEERVRSLIKKRRRK